jgi:endoglucanase
VYFLRSHNPLVYCGEFGVIDQAPLNSQLNWNHDFIGLLNKDKIGCAAWSYKEMDFGRVDRFGHVVSQELIKIITRR